MVNNDNMKCLSDHSAFKANADGKIEDGDKINCLCCYDSLLSMVQTHCSHITSSK